MALQEQLHFRQGVRESAKTLYVVGAADYGGKHRTWPVPLLGRQNDNPRGAPLDFVDVLVGRRGTGAEQVEDHAWSMGIKVFQQRLNARVLSDSAARAGRCAHEGFHNATLNRLTE
jgi:hypothetical protein